MTPEEHLRRNRVEAHARRVLTDLYARFDEDDVAAVVASVAALWLDERVMSDGDADRVTALLGDLAGKMKAERQRRGLDPTIVDPRNGPDGHGVPDAPDPALDRPGEFWVQGDCVRLRARSVFGAIDRYRALLTSAQIGISQGVHCDALHARSIARGHYVMRQTLRALVAGQRLGPEVTELLADALRNGAVP